MPAQPEPLLRDYADPDKLEDYGPDDSGNRLRLLLSGVAMPLLPQQARALSELLYTATERGILAEDAVLDQQELPTLLRLVELAKVIQPEELEQVRM